MKELQTIVDDSRVPAIDAAVFSDLSTSAGPVNFWSGSAYAYSSSDSQWFVQFMDALSNVTVFGGGMYGLNAALLVRCVGSSSSGAMRDAGASADAASD